MFTINKMEQNHLLDILEIEKESFAIPWSLGNFKNELSNKMAIYFVAIYENQIIGYGGMWHVINEGHITNVAVKKEYRHKGVGSAMINNLLEIAKNKEMIGITLEVRISNTHAQALYKKNGFIMEGIRKEYYDDNREDALIMWHYL